MDMLARVSRDFLKSKKVYRYRMKKISDMSDKEVISCCHCYCEENGLMKEWNEVRAEYKV